MNEAQRVAARQALNDWAEPQIAAFTGMFSETKKTAMREFLAHHGDDLVEAVGTAVLLAPSS